ADVARQLGVGPATSHAAHDVRNDLSPKIVRSLLAVVHDRWAEPMRVRIGFRVRDTWRLPDHRSLTVEFVVSGDQTAGHLIDQVTGHALTVAHACRSQHIT